MTAKLKDGGPAFPIPLHEGQSYQGHAPCDGMTLRDYFAAKAMGTLMQCCINDSHAGVTYEDHVANAAYVFADAMLAAREKQS